MAIKIQRLWRLYSSKKDELCSIMEDFAQVDYTFRMERMFDFQKVDTFPQTKPNDQRLTSDMLKHLEVFSIEEKIFFALDDKQPVLEVSMVDSEETKVSDVMSSNDNSKQPSEYFSQIKYTPGKAWYPSCKTTTAASQSEASGKKCDEILTETESVTQIAETELF